MIIGYIIIFSISVCGSNTSTATPNISSIIPPEDTTSTTNPNEDEDMKSLELKIGEITVDFIWLGNAPVNALKELAKDELTIYA